MRHLASSHDAWPVTIMMTLRPQRVGTGEATKPATRFRSACVVTANLPELNRRMPALARLQGDHFYLGSEYPQVFGDVMTGQLSCLWRGVRRRSFTRG